MVTGPDPDYSSLALRMGDAAHLLEEVSKLYGYINPAAANWSADDLRREAEHVEAASTRNAEA